MNDPAYALTYGRIQARLKQFVDQPYSPTLLARVRAVVAEELTVGLIHEGLLSTLPRIRIMSLDEHSLHIQIGDDPCVQCGLDVVDACECGLSRQS